jgi:hypothetical protein
MLEGGLVRREIKGREHRCRIDARPLRDADKWPEIYRQFWRQRLEALEVYVPRKFKASKQGKVHGTLD